VKESSNNESEPNQDTIIANDEPTSNDKENAEDIMLKNKRMIDSLKREGIVGKWEGYSSGIKFITTFVQTGNDYARNVEYVGYSMKVENEKLIKKNNKYFTINKGINEHYLIKQDGSLELWDNQGLVSASKSLIPIVTKAEKPATVENPVGKNIFEHSAKYSQSSPETLSGTNNEFWIVYYKDLNCTFKVLKKTDIIQSQSKGKVPNMN
jgi:hypothetical protein